MAATERLYESMEGRAGSFLLCGGRAKAGEWLRLSSTLHRHSSGCELFSSFFFLKKKRFLGNARWSGLCLDWPHNPLTSKHFTMPVRLWWVMYYSSRLVTQCNCCCLYRQRRPGSELAWSSLVLNLLLKPFQGKSLWQKAFTFINWSNFST